MRINIDARELLLLSLTIALVLLSILQGAALLRFQTYTSGSNTLTSFQGTGLPAPVYWGGSGERINNTSFENGIIQPWVELQYNSNGSIAQVVPRGYNSNLAANISIQSGNLTTYSYTTLLQDLSQNSVGFGNGVTLQAAVQLQALKGNTSSDRVEIMLTLASSIGNTTRMHYAFSSGRGLLPANTTSDAYFKVAGFNGSGWIPLNRNLAFDALSVFPRLYPSISAIKDMSLTVYARSLGIPTVDPRIKFYDFPDLDKYWNATETVVYDPDADGLYNSATDLVLYSGTNLPFLVNGTPLINDPRIKFVDLNLDGRWNQGEPIVYDRLDEGVYDQANNDPVICGDPPYCSKPIAGSLLQDPLRRVTTALFDQVQLFTPIASRNWVLNGGFETGSLTGWGQNTTFVPSTTSFHSGGYSAYGAATNTIAQLAQSIDAAPRINGWTTLQASVNLAFINGITSSDTVDIWLGLSDSRGAPVSLFYMFYTGDRSIPGNSTGFEYIKSPGFGTFQQWLTLNRSLFMDTLLFTLQGYTPPYSVNLVVLEVAAQGPFSTTKAYFDDISILSPTLYVGSIPMAYYALDRLNTTYTYTVSNIPSSSFSLQIPRGQSPINVTAPGHTLLVASDYNITQASPGLALVNIPDSTGSRYPNGAPYRIYTTSRNLVTTLAATDTETGAQSSSFTQGSRATLVSQSQDPLGQAISGANVTLLLVTGSGNIVGNWTGTSNNQGWYNATKVTLPSNTGGYMLEARTISPFYAGIRTAPLTITSAIPWTLIAYVLIAGAGVAIFAFILFRERRRKKTLIQDSQQKQAPKKKLARP